MPLLMQPGPVMISPEVQSAMARPAESHHSPEFYRVFDQSCSILRQLFGTSGQAVILPGSGRLGLEAGVVSLCRPGARTLHIVNGFFAAWTVEIARRAGCDATVLELPWEQPADPAAVERALRDQGPFHMVFMVHSETATGQLNPVSAVGQLCREHGALFMVDAISSLAVAPLDMDRDGIDLCVTASQKGVCAPMGLSIVGIGPRAQEQLSAPGASICQSFALDLKRWEEFWKADRARPYPVVPSTHLVHALYTSLQQIVAEGPESRIRRHAAVSAAMREAVAVLGLRVWPAAPSPSVTAVAVPHRLTSHAILTEMNRRGVSIAAGMGRVTGTVIRISHMGDQARLRPLIHTAEALGESLNALGHTCDAKAAVRVLRAQLEPGP